MSTGKKIATGCGIGCLLLAIIAGGVGTCGYLGVRKAIDRAEDFETVYDDLNARHGDPADHVPAADGRIDPAQIEVFLTIREQLLAGSEETVEKLRILDDAPGASSGPLDKLKAGIGVIPAVMNFMVLHSGTLLEQGMGLGEYAYLYALSYYALLGEDPGAGPDFMLESHDRDEGANVHWSTGSEADAHERRDGEVREQLNSILRQVLQNQLDAALAAGAPADWVDQLTAEVALMNEDWERLPWEDGLPEPLASSLAPYRARLADTWSPSLNTLEMGALHR
jgi:hypothetical protein